MILHYNHIKQYSHLYKPFLTRISGLYSLMDLNYQTVANTYDFDCRECNADCCRTYFFHHTLLEYLYLYEGYNHLTSDIQLRIQQKALKIHTDQIEEAQKRTMRRQMCPLNVDSLCLLYDYRPMICRLHGIAYELRQPNGTIFSGQGCGMFTQQCQDKSYVKFDRTSFYTAMAELEKELRKVIGIKEKVKFTVAQILKP